jgi:hypothetical protein
LRNAPEKTELPGFGFLRQAKNEPWGDETHLREGKNRAQRIEEGDWVYTILTLGAKMEIPVNIRIGQVKRKTAESRGAFDSTERIILPRTHKRNHRGRKSLSWRTLPLWRSGPPLGERKTAGLQAGTKEIL